MDDSAAAMARLARLLGRIEAALERRAAQARDARAALTALRADRDALAAAHASLLAEVETLRAACADADSARLADQALRAEAADALDRAIAELRSMGETDG